MQVELETWQLHALGSWHKNPRKKKSVGSTFRLLTSNLSGNGTEPTMSTQLRSSLYQDLNLL